MEPRQDHLQTISAAEYLRDLDPDGAYIAAEAAYSPDPAKSNRYILFREKENRIEAIRNAWLTPEVAAEIAAQENLRIGKSDAMYMIAPTLVWCQHEDTFRVFRNEELILNAANGFLTLPGFFPKAGPLPNATIQKIRVYLERGWVVCGVKLMFQEGEIVLAEQVNEIASVDITYDAFNLMADTWWAVSLGSALSKYLDCPYEADEDLR